MIKNREYPRKRMFAKSSKDNIFVVDGRVGVIM